MCVSMYVCMYIKIMSRLTHGWWGATVNGKRNMHIVSLCTVSPQHLGSEPPHSEGNITMEGGQWEGRERINIENSSGRPVLRRRRAPSKTVKTYILKF